MDMAACPWACFATGGGGGALSATHQRESSAKFSCISRTSAQFSGALTLEPCVFQRKNGWFWRGKSSLSLPKFFHTQGSACLLADGRVSLVRSVGVWIVKEEEEVEVVAASETGGTRASTRHPVQSQLTTTPRPVNTAPPPRPQVARAP